MPPLTARLNWPGNRWPRRPWQVWRRWTGDRSGNVAIITAFASTALLGFGAIGVDGGHFYFMKRKLQSATDMAAMAAASNPGSAAQLAASSMAANGFPAATLQITRGTYTADPNLPAASRFDPTVASNAVEVVASTQEAFIFGAAFRLLLPSAHASERDAATTGTVIRARAVARNQDSAAFTLGSGLVAENGGVLNSVLGALLGTTLSFSLADYQSLASAKVDLFAFSDALAMRGSISGPTYGSAAAAVISQSAALNALADSVQGGSQVAALLRQVAGSMSPGSSVALSRLIDFGPGNLVRIGASHPYSARVPALSLLSAIAQFGGVNHSVSVALGASVPGLSATTLMLTVGEPAVGTSFFTAGSAGTELHTAQIRLLLSTQVGGSGLPAPMSVPIYVELASARAAISRVACEPDAPNASVSLDVSTGLVNAALGQVSPTDFGNLASAPSVGSATLINVAGLVRVNALSQLSATPPGAIPVSFSATDIQSATSKTVSSGVSLAAVASSLVSQTQVSVSVLGIFPAAATLPQLVKASLQSALQPIDLVLGQAFAALGLSIGTATVTVPGVRCGMTVLVN